MSYGDKPRRVSGKQLRYVKDLMERVGADRAREVGQAALGLDILERLPNQEVWQKETRLDRITSAEATTLINALKEAK